MSGVLVVDIAPASDDLRYFEGRAAARLVPQVPKGVTVELQIGGTTPLPGLLGPLIEALRPAGAIVVRGTNPAGVEATYRALSIGLARSADAE